MSRQFTYWQDADGTYLGYFNDYPEYPTQGSSLDELKFMLTDILGAIRDGDLVDTPANRHTDTLVCA